MRSESSPNGPNSIDPSSRARLEQAEDLYRSGEAAQLVALLEDEASWPNDGDIHTRLLTLRAFGLYDTGRVAEALEQFDQALLQCRTAPAGFQFKLAFDRFVRASDYRASQDILLDLARLRQLASSAGDASSMARLHLAVARLEGCRGNCTPAHRHLTVAKRLAEFVSDDGIDSVVRLVEAPLALFTGNLRRARTIAEDCFANSKLSGFERYRSAAAVLIAQVAICLGEISTARTFLDFARRTTAGMGAVRIAALDCCAQLEIFDGTPEQVRKTLELSRSFDLPLAGENLSWNDLEHLQTLVSFHELQGDWRNLLRVVDMIDIELSKRQFRSLRTALRSAKSRALAHLGDRAGALAHLSSAASVAPTGSFDSQLTLEVTKAVCHALSDSPHAARPHFDRALAACRAVGHRYYERWIERTQQRLEARSRVAVGGRTPERDLHDTAMLMTDVAGILGAGHSIDLLAHRTLAVLRSTPMNVRLDVQTESGLPYVPTPASAWQTGADGTFHLSLRGSDKRVDIRGRDVRSLDEIAFTKSVADLVHAAVSRTLDPGASGEEQSLWPCRPDDHAEDIVFESPRMTEIVRIAERLASTNLPILIAGETGTGKEILARLIHQRSQVARGPFVPFNCSAIPRELVESQLFGHRRGAFTGAMDSFPGVIRAAERGTLFLDELGDLDPAAQPKLLRFLEGGEILPVGENRTLHVGVRIVAATNADLEGLVDQGRFRRDLFYRIGGARIVLPPLRERKDEIPAFARLFLKRFSVECGRSGLRLGDDFIAALLLHDWPGNIRQLANEMRRAIALAPDNTVLGAADLAPEVTRAWNARPVAVAAPAHPSVEVRLDQPLASALRELEQRFIEHALDLAGGRVAEAAQRLGLSRKGLFLKRRRGRAVQH